jgi:hypothetical protein
MPLVDFNDPAIWDGGPTSLYRDGEGRGYVRGAMDAYLGERDASHLWEALGIKPLETVIIVGAAYGWLAEAWEAAGLGPIHCLDTSDYIHEHKGEHARLPILKLDPGEMSGDLAQWCISEDVMPTLSDEEAKALAERMSHVASKVAHWVSTRVGEGQDPRLNWKTLEEWKEILSPDLVVSRNDGRVL